MRQALTLPDELVKELKARAGTLGITPSRLAEVFLARGLRSTDPIVLEVDHSRSYNVTPAHQKLPAKPTVSTQPVPEEEPDWLTSPTVNPHQW